jgi:FkbM family methyltransferase
MPAQRDDAATRYPVRTLQNDPNEEPISPAFAVARAMSSLHHGICIPNYEELLYHGYRRFLDHTSITVDVGANVGFHTSKLLAYGRVIAFEPVPEQAARLRDHFAGWSNVEIREIALGRTAGEQSFHHFPSGHGKSGLHARTDQAEPATMIRVRVDTIDNQLRWLDRLDYIKIDIEGGEIDCLLGGRATITRLRPYISVEYGQPGYAPYHHTADTLFLVAWDFGYVISDLFGNLVETREEWGKICDFSYWDYFLIPKEKRPFWRAAFAKTQPGTSDR